MIQHLHVYNSNKTIQTNKLNSCVNTMAHAEYRKTPTNIFTCFYQLCYKSVIKDIFTID